MQPLATTFLKKYFLLALLQKNSSQVDSRDRILGNAWVMEEFHFYSGEKVNPLILNLRTVGELHRVDLLDARVSNLLKKCKAHLQLANTMKGVSNIGSERSNYGILQIRTHFTNLSFALTTLDGKVRRWTSAGCSPDQSYRTRMSTLAVKTLMQRFIQDLQEDLKTRQEKLFLKVQFIGPSNRYRVKLLRLLFRRPRAYRKRYRFVCVEEAFHRSFKGSRLKRRPR